MEKTPQLMHIEQEIARQRSEMERICAESKTRLQEELDNRIAAINKLRDEYDIECKRLVGIGQNDDDAKFREWKKNTIDSISELPYRVAEVLFDYAWNQSEFNATQCSRADLTEMYIERWKGLAVNISKATERFIKGE